MIFLRSFSCTCVLASLLLAGQAPSPEAVAASSVLRTAVSDESSRRFYSRRGWRQAWDGRHEQALLESLDRADRHGLRRTMFLDGELPDDPVQREAALTRAALDYAQALAVGRVDPASLRSIFTLDRPRTDVADGLDRALAQGNLAEWLGSLAPQDDAYRALSDAHVRLRGQADQRHDPIGGGPLIHEGDRDPRVARIASRLAELGYLQPGLHDRSDRFDGALVAAVERLQADSGIAVDGIVGPETLGRLNRGPADRARTLAVNLERRRWLKRDPPSTRIDVNVAATRLHYWRDDRIVDSRRVIAGQPGWETPRLGSPIFRLVANPTWTVPKSIERRELAGRGEAYLRRNDMVRRGGWIVQLSGPNNALGQVKFDMHNDYAIFLHDTPAKHLFERNRRHRSHGCVRVENALEFARMLARDQGVLAEFEQALASGQETFVPLPRHVPVRLLYHTAFVDSGGNATFRPDIYGWDADVAEALGLGPGPRRTPPAHVDDGVTP